MHFWNMKITFGGGKMEKVKYTSVQIKSLLGSELEFKENHVWL